MKNCVFCKIAAGQMDAAKIWEDKDFMAILDINPNVKGMALIFPKKHFDSDVFDMSDDFYSKLMLVSKKVAKILEKGLNVRRVALVMEGMGVNHAHIKLYPLHGLSEKFQEMWAKKRIYFNKYEGYLSTQLGPKVDLDELRKLSKKIVSKN